MATNRNEYMRIRRSTPEEKMKRRMKYLATKEHVKKVSHEYYKRNKDAILEKTKAYQKENPDVKRKSAERRRGVTKERSKKYREELTDFYIRDLVTGKNSRYLKRTDFDFADLIEATRWHLKFKRLIASLNT